MTPSFGLSVASRSSIGVKDSRGSSQMPGGWPGPPNQCGANAAMPCAASSRTRSVAVRPLDPDSTSMAALGDSSGMINTPSGDSVTARSSRESSCPTRELESLR
jgi:hypothetical protein